MMSILITFLLTISNAHSIEYQSIWERSPENGSLEKKVKMTCSPQESTCEDTCANVKSCHFYEPTCIDCIGTNIKITHIFKEMGRSYRSTGKEVREQDVLYLLRTEDFVSLTSKSIYNHTQRYNSLEMQRRFRSLCPDFVNYPIVFFEANPKNGKIGQVKFVICGEKYFEMTDRPRLRQQDEEKLDHFLM